MSVPPVDPALLRAIFDDESPATPPAPVRRKGPVMIKRLALGFATIAALALPASALGKPPAGGDPQAIDPQAIDRLVSTCRLLAATAARTGDRGPMDRYIARLLADRERRQAEIIACGAYLAGARDMAAGRILPLDVN